MLALVELEAQVAAVQAVKTAQLFSNPQMEPLTLVVVAAVEMTSMVGLAVQVS
jgi:hypothetical protein